MSPYALPLVLQAALIVLACAPTQLNPEAANVVASESAPSRQWSCENLGEVSGDSGGPFKTSWPTNQELIEQAMNDLRNEAAEMRANYVHHQPVTLAPGHGVQTVATFEGTAYRCTAAPAQSNRD